MVAIEEKGKNLEKKIKKKFKKEKNNRGNENCCYQTALIPCYKYENWKT